RVLDERQRLRRPPRHRLRASVQPVPPHETQHPLGDPRGPGEGSARGHPRPRADRPRPSCHRAAAGRSMSTPSTRAVVVGSGLAGLTAAWALAPQECLLITPAELTGGAASMWAQGGVAAALADDDSPALHADDTLRAGAYAGDRAAIAR